MIRPKLLYKKFLNIVNILGFMYLPKYNKAYWDRFNGGAETLDELDVKAQRHEFIL